MIKLLISNYNSRLDITSHTSSYSFSTLINKHVLVQLSSLFSTLGKHPKLFRLFASRCQQILTTSTPTINLKSSISNSIYGLIHISRLDISPAILLLCMSARLRPRLRFPCATNIAIAIHHLPPSGLRQCTQCLAQTLCA